MRKLRILKGDIAMDPKSKVGFPVIDQSRSGKELGSICFIIITCKSLGYVK